MAGKPITALILLSPRYKIVTNPCIISRMPQLQISCLGDFTISLAGKPITANFDTDKTRALLIYLVVEAAHAHPRQRLAGLLWPDQPEERALQNLRQRLSQLRKLLGDGLAANPPFLLTTRDSVQWNPACDFLLDTAAFERTLNQAYRHYQRRGGTGSLVIRTLKKALQHYTGEFLERFNLYDSDLFEEWAALQREKFNRMAVETLAMLADYYEQRGENSLARQAALRLVALAPWEETAQAQIMRLFAADKQWSAAQNQYALLRRYLRQQVGVEPTGDTAALFEQIRLAAAQNAAVPPRFPPAAHNLPAPPTAFVGREVELDFLGEKLADPECRLLTLLGPGGIGKTRLALEAAREMIGLFPDGVYFISLAAASTPEHLLLGIADAVGFAFAERGDPKGQLLAFLRSRRMLLVLDTFEHLLPVQGSLALISEILQQAAGVKLLVTSRERLKLREETIYHVDGLSYPKNPALPLEAAAAYDALALFTRCARQVNTGFTLDAAALSPAIRICQILAGLPLGIELAAAATWDYTPAEIAERIAADFSDLTAAAANMPPRHRSLRAAFEISWNLLSPDQQKIFCRLAVFRGGFTAQAAAAVAQTAAALDAHDSLPPESFTEHLAVYVDKSLLRRAPDGRYSLHEAIRQYAADRLAAEPDLAAAAHARHAQFYAQYLAAHNTALKSPAQATALEALHLEIENARFAWEWLVENQCSAEIYLCADSLFHYINIRSNGLADGISWFQQAVQAFTHVESGVLALGICLARLGALAYRMRNNTLAHEALTRSHAIFNQLNEPGEIAFCLIFLSGLHLRQAGYELAIATAKQSLALYRRLGDRWGEVYALHLLGLIKDRQGAFDEALPFLEAALQLGRQVGDPHRLIGPLNILGDIACVKGDYSAAEKYFLESLEISRALNDRYNQGLLLNNLATIYQAQAQYSKEKEAFEASLAICREIGDRDGEAIALNGLGEMAVHLGEYAQAAVYSQQALCIAQQMGEVWTVIICLNNLGEALCGLGDLKQAEAHLQQARQFAREIDVQDLVARVEASLGRVYQRSGDIYRARQFYQEALANPALEDEPRTKVMKWMAEA